MNWTKMNLGQIVMADLAPPYGVGHVYYQDRCRTMHYMGSGVIRSLYRRRILKIEITPEISSNMSCDLVLGPLGPTKVDHFC